MIPVSRETEDRLKAYQALLHKWQEKINLVSPGTVSDSWERHFEDSFQLLPLVPNGLKTLYDLGCGAGFPGLVLAIARPELSVTLIESDSKKCAFLQTVSRETNTKVMVHNSRIEAASSVLPPPDIITARALAPLETLFSYVFPWVKQSEDISLIFPKGQNWEAEIRDAKAAGWDFELNDSPSQTDKSARILVFTSLRKSPV